MFRELRITVLIVLVYFIYGLSSLFSLGDFVTPFFFSKLILVLVSLVFFLLNWRVERSIYLFFAFLAYVSYAAADLFTLNLMTKSGQYEQLYAILNSRYVLIGSLFIFFGFFYTSLFLLYNVLKNLIFRLLLFSLLTVSLVGLFFSANLVFEIFFGLYLLLYFIIVYRLSLSEKSILSILSSLFLLQFLLESFKYLI